MTSSLRYVANGPEVREGTNTLTTRIMLLERAAAEADGLDRRRVGNPDHTECQARR